MGRRARDRGRGAWAGSGAHRRVERDADEERGRRADRAAAAFALGQLGMAWEPVGDAARGKAEATLVAALPSERDPSVRDRVVEALGKVGGHAAAVALVAALDGKERVRAAVALAALAKAKVPHEPGTREKLEKLLADKDAQARWAAALALLRLTRSGEPRRRCAAARRMSRCTCARPAPRRSPTSAATKDADVLGAARRGQGRAGGGGGGAHARASSRASAPTAAVARCARCRTHGCRGARRWCRR